MAKFVTVYDTRTGRKLGHQVPDTWLRIYPHLSETPAAKGRRKKKNTATPAPEPTSEATTTAPEEEASNGDQSS